MESDIEPKRLIVVLAINTPLSGRLRANAGSSEWGSGPMLSRTRKWTQPQDRRKARTGAGEERGKVEMEEEKFEEVLRWRTVKLPNRRASSLALEWLRVVNRAAAEPFVFSLS